MPSFSSIVSLTALAATVYAAPTPGSGVSITQVAGAQVLKNGPLEVAKTFAKYGKAPPANILKAAKPVQSGSVTATPEDYDIEYLCPVTVGGTTLNLDLDTGSTDLWVFSSLLPKNQQTGHSIYTAKSSNLIASRSWSLSYADFSSASGTVYTDSVSIGGVTATSVPIEAAAYVSDRFVADTASDGLMGLGFPKLNSCAPKQCKTFFQAVRSTFASGQELFTAALKYHAPGTINFGYIDSAAYKGDITYVPVKKGKGYWGLETQGYSIGGGNVTKVALSGIADTGSTLLYQPDSIVKKYYAQVPKSTNNNGYSFPCNAVLPDFGLMIGGVLFTIPGQYLTYAPNNDAANTCFGALQSSEGLGLNIIGDAFLKSVFAVFDVGGLRLGFAQQA